MTTTASPDRPTLAELRAVVQKNHHRVIGNWLARRVGRPSAVYGTWLAVRLGVSAHAVTAAALGTSVGSAVLIGSGTRWGFVAGVGLAYAAFWLDHVDGQVARWRGSSSLDGVYFDYLLHHVANLTLGFALGFGLAARSGDVGWAAAGAAIATGWAVLSLHNDCRYKAFFQRLKASAGAFRVEGGAGGRPAPPPGWPRRGLGMLTWPAFKLCEGHVVLIGLAILAGLAAVAPGVWVEAWRWSVRGMMVLAPTLAALRVARSIRAGGAEAEFTRWFHPDPPGPTSPA